MFTTNRRDLLYGLGASLGSVAFTAMLADADENRSTHGPHFPTAKAKRCIFLYMEGGPSHIDTFDPKPELQRLHLKEFQRSGQEQSAMSSGKRYYVGSPFKFRKVGQSGADMCDRWEHLAGVADQLCFYRGCQVESVSHPTANYHINTGNRFGGDPSIGAWVNYGLGSESENLPGYIVLPEVADPQGGSANWSNGFLPTAFQGTPLRSAGSPILDIARPPGVTREHQGKNLDFLSRINRQHASRHPGHDDLAARMRNDELAFRMQMEVPQTLRIDEESQATLNRYGVGVKPTDNFARRCLLSRKLIEQGVRFVQVYASTWDSHDYLAKAHGALIPSVDRPIAALISDLRDRGLLGLDDRKLTFHHSGRFKQLSQFGGDVIEELIA